LQSLLVVKESQKLNSKIQSIFHQILKMIMSVLIFITVLFIAYVILNEQTFIQTSPTMAADQPQTITIQTGDTLWKIAKIHAPEHLDFTDYMKKIKKANKLKSYSIQAGQTLKLP
jgi:LysM repeat protein